MLSDGELLRQYNKEGSQAAFTTLVQRHINMVYRTVLRRVGGNAHAADDVTQRVFTALARKAGTLTSRESLAGWLYSSARFAAAEVVRSEQRRRQHEHEAHTMNELNAVDSIPAEKFEPFFDEFMEGLPDRDREAVLLHFFEGRTFPEIGQAFSMSPDAARMRVSRAVDRLRGEMEGRGVKSTAAAVAAVLATQSAALAGAPSAVALATRAIADAGAGCAATAGAGAKALAAAKLPLAFGVGVVAIVIGIGGGAYAYRMSTEAVVGEPVAIAQPAAPTIQQNPEPGGSYVAPSATIPSAQKVAVLGRAARMASPVEPASFEGLTAEEKNLLAILWRGLDNARPGVRTVVRVGLAAPNNAGLDPLLRSRLVAMGTRQVRGCRSVYLTVEGIAYCSANRAAVEAYVPSGNFVPTPKR